MGILDQPIRQVNRTNGEEITSDDPCEHIRFSNAQAAANPSYRRTGSEQSWIMVQGACPTETLSAPFGIDEITTAPDEEEQTQDSAQGQGIDFPENDNEGQIEDIQEDPSENIPPDEEPTRPPEGEPHPTHSGEQPEQQTNAGDPVDIFSGSFYLEETDLTIPNTIIPLSFTRFYRSGSASFGPLGWNWDHNFNLFIRELATGAIALWRNLHEVIFTFTGADYEPPRGIFEKLERVAGHVFEIKGRGGLTMHFERPLGWLDGERIPLLWLTDQHGNQLHFTYGPEDKLAEVRDDDDRFFKFEYDACGLLVLVADHAQREFRYDHNEETMQLVCAISPVIKDHPRGIIRIYHYEQPWALPELRHNIVRVEDASGNVYMENTYDQDPASWSYSRVTEQLYGGFLFQFQYTQLQWVPADGVFINIPSLRIEVMNPDYGVETYTFNYRGDLLDRRYRLSKDKSFRVVVWQYEFDEQGNLYKTTKPDGSEDINIFDVTNIDPRMRSNLLQKEITSASGFPSPSRIIWRGSYEPITQQLKEEIDETGAIMTYRYDYDVTPAVTTNTGKRIEIVHPEATLPDGTIQRTKNTFEYNAKGQLTATIKADGTRYEFEYGTNGQEKSRLVKQIFDVENLAIEQVMVYDNLGFSTETIDGNGNTTGQVFNALGLVEKKIMPTINGSPSEYNLLYDADKKVIATERPKGNFEPLPLGNHIIDRFERDILGYPIKYTLSSNSGEARIFEMCNDYRGNPVNISNPDGSSIKKTFDERGLPLREEVVGTDGKTIGSRNVYDRSGKLIQEIDPFGRTKKYEYDGFSRISKTMLSNGSEVINKWDKNDLLRSRETIGDDGTGTISQLAFTSYSYDEKNRKIKETVKVFTDDPTVATQLSTTFFYDTRDRLCQVVNNRGGISTNAYDGLGRIFKETDFEGNEEHYTYDNNGNLIQRDSHHKEPDGSVSIITKKLKYDARNRRIELIEPDGSRITTEYDDRNLLVKITDRLGIIKEVLYNSHNNKTQEIQDSGGLNSMNRWGVDSMSRITSYIDPTGQTSSYVFDSVGRNYKTVYPNGFESIKIFNDLNQVLRETLASGAAFEYGYDTAQRIVKITNVAFPAPLKKIGEHTFAYDGLDRVYAAKTGVNEIFRTYDSLGRLLGETTLNDTISCIYDDVNGIVNKSWPDGRVEQLAHDLNGILTGIEQIATGNLGSSNAQIAAFRTSGPNAMAMATFQGNLTLKNSYDDRKRLTDVTIESAAGINENLKYCYNKADIEQVEALIGQNPRTSYFEFDHKHRLELASDGFMVDIPTIYTQGEHDTAISLIKIAAAGAAYTEEFEYDSADARTKYTKTEQPDKNYSFLNGHRIQDDGTNAYNYHTDGTLASRGSQHYDVDALSRIIAIKQGADLLTEIEYDAFGRPSIVKEMGKPDKSFNYLGGFVEQENEDGVASRQLTLQPGTGVPIAYHSRHGTHYTLFDNRFNLIGLMDASGNLLESYRYEPFGAPNIFDNTGDGISSSVLGAEPVFGGQRYLSSSGLYLSKRRLMNPVDGVYLSIDPKGYADSSSLYIYAAQDPINNIDPNGEIIPFIIAAFVIGGAIAGAGYSAYDAYHNPNKYEGPEGSLRVLGNVFGGAIIGGVSVVAGEAVLATGGAGIFATGTGATATSLTATQTFVLYGTASASSGAVGRGGFNALFPEYVDPVSPTTLGTDYFIGGGLGVAFRGLGLATSSNNTWTLQGDREAILESRRIWGQTEGSVYAMDTPNLPSWRATGGGTVSSNSAIFEFRGVNNIFSSHEITGPLSLIKRLLGQSKAGFGDIAFDEAVQIGTRIVGESQIPVYRLSGVRLLPGDFAGQTVSQAARRLWGRRIGDVGMGTGLLTAFGLNAYDFFDSSSQAHPNDAVSKK